MNYAVKHTRLDTAGRAKIKIRAGIVPKRVFLHKKGCIIAISETIIQDSQAPNTCTAQDFRQTLAVKIDDQLPKSGYVYFSFE